MLKIFECVDGGSDGRDTTTIGYTTTRELAEKVVKGRGTFSVGDGSIYEVDVWETTDDVTVPMKG